MKSLNKNYYTVSTLNRIGLKSGIPACRKRGYITTFCFMQFTKKTLLFNPEGRHTIDTHNRHNRKMVRKIEKRFPFRLRANKDFSPLRMNDWTSF